MGTTNKDSEGNFQTVLQLEQGIETILELADIVCKQSKVVTPESYEEFRGLTFELCSGIIYGAHGMRPLLHQIKGATEGPSK